MGNHVNKSLTNDFPLTVRTHNLTKRFGDKLAVNQVNLSIRHGEIYGFLGPNGAGKTTTMRMLLGLVKPTSGGSEVLGFPGGDPHGLARVGAMVENPAFYPFLSGRDNLALFARQGNLPKSSIMSSLESVGLAERARDRFATYSQGMKQRLGIAAALMKDPALLILDEPTNGLDPAGLSEMRTLIRHLRDIGKTILLSSHQLGEVEEVCDRVGVVFKGKLVTESTIQELRGEAGLVILASPLSDAKMHLVRIFGESKVHVEGDTIRLDVGPSEAGKINRELLEEGIDVREVRRYERSLEEIFLTMNETYSGESGGRSDG